ncbi:7-carboxy-7-deazaguanine synthase [Oxobacter pfennigii]|uniref:7-carboxy-7-deazaguanine synthase n=1 Tax=Oxobacter pfennigii TaxID=36849 RepID=A0A0P8X604_9CLOT|nr:AmmeMemoRadiSam system radical SAM enzyme [Oxobacter pfennigii]KPU46349.1 7-carboxy-7-deazaguanine synthase [Oxobacter pfennigii]
MKEAGFYKKLKDNLVKCNLCPNYCVIENANLGSCRTRKNTGGTLYTLNYNRIAALALDPIEKKPLYHFYPGTKILSAGTLGCNLKCSFCQNWHIAQDDADTQEITGERLVDIAIKQESLGIAFTYNEPFIWYEYIYEIAKLCKKKGLKYVLVTNGYVNEEPLNEMLHLIDAMNIDVKGFTGKFYKDICKGILEPVKRTVEKAASQCHIEVTTLVVTDLNDTIDEIRELSLWLSSIDKNIPLHLSRYFPNYKLDNPPTPLNTLKMLYDEAKKHLNYVYLGNVADKDNTTYCPKCKNPLVKRGSNVTVEGIYKGKCKNCSESINIIY